MLSHAEFTFPLSFGKSREFLVYIRFLPTYVFLFAALVEAAQYIDVVKLLGWEDNAILSTLIGRTFSWADILCYGVGCVAFWAAEKRVIFRWKERQKER